MKCLVTAGPTYEPLDDVRRLTNFSTGRLGTELAAFLASRGHDVTLLRGEQATWTQPVDAEIIGFTTTTDLRDRLSSHSTPEPIAVFHAAAVSDFAFGKIWQRSAAGEPIPVDYGKISSGLKNLFAELVPTPKIIGQLRAWFPAGLLVGWKFEVDGTRESAVEQAREQIVKSRTDACIVNGPAYGPGFGILTATVRHCATREELFEQLAAMLPKPGR